MNTNRLEQVAVDLCKLDKEIELLRHAKNHIKNFEVMVNGYRFYFHGSADAPIMQAVIEAMLPKKEQEMAKLKEELKDIVRS